MDNIHDPLPEVTYGSEGEPLDEKQRTDNETEGPKLTIFDNMWQIGKPFRVPQSTAQCRVEDVLSSLVGVSNACRERQGCILYLCVLAMNMFDLYLSIMLRLTRIALDRYRMPEALMTSNLAKTVGSSLVGEGRMRRQSQGQIRRFIFTLNLM